MTYKIVEVTNKLSKTLLAQIPSRNLQRIFTPYVKKDERTAQREYTPMDSARIDAAALKRSAKQAKLRELRGRMR